MFHSFLGGLAGTWEVTHLGSLVDSERWLVLGVASGVAKGLAKD